MRRILVVVVLVALALPVHAETVSLSDVLSGKLHPLTIKLQDLNGEWSRFAATGADPMPNPYMQMISMYAAGLGMGTHHYYTKGETISLAGGETYLVAYSPPPKPLDPSALNRPEPPTLQKLTPESILSLSLLSLRSMGSLTNIKTFDLDAEIKDSGGAEQQEEDSPSASQDNLKRLGLAIQMYSCDWDGILPPMDDAAAAKKALDPYVDGTGKTVDVFLQPETGKPYAPNSILSKRKVAHISNPSEMVVFYEAEPGEDGSRNAVFMDGHVSRISPSQWPLVKRQSKIP